MAACWLTAYWRRRGGWLMAAAWRRNVSMWRETAAGASARGGISPDNRRRWPWREWRRRSGGINDGVLTASAAYRRRGAQRNGVWRNAAIGNLLKYGVAARESRNGGGVASARRGAACRQWQPGGWRGGAGRRSVSWRSSAWPGSSLWPSVYAWRYLRGGWRMAGGGAALMAAWRRRGGGAALCQCRQCGYLASALFNVPAIIEENGTACEMNQARRNRRNISGW